MTWKVSKSRKTPTQQHHRYYSHQNEKQLTLSPNRMVKLHDSKSKIYICIHKVSNIIISRSDAGSLSGHARHMDLTAEQVQILKQPENWATSRETLSSGFATS